MNAATQFLRKFPKRSQRKYHTRFVRSMAILLAMVMDMAMVMAMVIMEDMAMEAGEEVQRM